MSSANLWIPQHLRPSRKLINIVFWYSKRMDRVEVGLPEQYPVPPIMAKMGFEKIVCTTAHDVERWSQKKREQDNRDQEMTDYERELAEGPIREALKQDLIYRLRNARDRVNKEFCAYALQKLEERERQGKEIRESYMRVEAYEDGK